MKRIIIYLVCILLLSGCTAENNITMNYDGTTSEKIDIINNNENIKYGNKSIEDSISLFLKKYETALKVGKYGTDIHVGENQSGVKISRSYDDICSFVNQTIFSQYVYDKFDCIENDYYYEIKSVGNAIKNTDRYDTWLAPDTIKISINLPVSAEEQNADEINGNTYIWKYDENATDKNFYLKISKSALKQNEEEYLQNIEKKKYKKRCYFWGNRNYYCSRGYYRCHFI